MLTLLRLHGSQCLPTSALSRPAVATRVHKTPWKALQLSLPASTRQMAYSATSKAPRSPRRTEFDPKKPSTRRTTAVSKSTTNKDKPTRGKPKKTEVPVPTTALTKELMSNLEEALEKTKIEPLDPSLTLVEERVAKRIARCGLCSRREAERWIFQGRVKIDGEIVSELGATVRPGQVLAVDDIPIRAEAPKLFIFNKVRNMLITRAERDDKSRETLGQLLTEMGEPTLLPVGRLDYTSEGLLLLTNDGELKRYLEHPDSNILRVYRVRVYGRVSQDRFAGVERGITIDGFKYRGAKITVENPDDRKGPRPAPQRNVEKAPPAELRANTWLRVELHEGKNREIRRIMEHYGLEVSRLIRIQYGPYKLTREIESGIVAPAPIVPELQPHTNQNWDWHPSEKAHKPALADRLKMPKSKKPPSKKPAPAIENEEEPL